jgi:hypothetical protein
MGIPLACISDFDADTLMNETVYFGFATLPATGARTSNRRVVTAAAPPRRPNQAKKWFTQPNQDKMCRE